MLCHQYALPIIEVFIFRLKHGCKEIPEDELIKFLGEDEVREIIFYRWNCIKCRDQRSLAKEKVNKTNRTSTNLNTIVLFHQK